MKFEGIGNIQGISQMKSQYNTNVLAQTSNPTDYAQLNKKLWANYYGNFFSNLATSFFLYEDLPNNIPFDFMERQFYTNGLISLVETKNTGFFALDGVITNEFNVYYKGVNFQPNTRVELREQLGIKDKYEIIYPENKLATWGNDKAVVIGNTQTYQPYIQEVALFCEKLAMIELAIQQNRMLLSKPFIVVGNEDNMRSVENMFKSIFNLDPYVKVSEQKTENGTTDFTQMKDYITTLNLGTQSHLVDLQDEKQRIIAQLLTLLGINNISIDKNDRLTHAESISNSGLISANINVRLKPRKEGFECFNELTGHKVKVNVNEMISNFNMQTVTDIIDEDIEGDYNE